MVFLEDSPINTSKKVIVPLLGDVLWGNILSPKRWSNDGSHDIANKTSIGIRDILDLFVVVSSPNDTDHNNDNNHCNTSANYDTHLCQREYVRARTRQKEVEVDQRTFISFHHIFFRTRLAPRLNVCALMARLSVLSWSESSRSPLSATLVMFSLMIPTVSSICCWMAAVFALPLPVLDSPPPGAPEPGRGTYGS
jgi:hypothetical protein